MLRWLYAVSLAIMLIGIAREFLSLIFYFAPGRFQVRYPADVNAYIMFAYGVLGALMQGWGVGMFMIVRGPFRRRESGGWALLAVPMLIWFVADTGFSLCTGFWQNGILNAVLLLLLAIPLAATRKYFNGKG
ncbi:hypothetical protein EST62_02935 [Chlorobaculum sp. 24CR]|uniref:hypothetical protein n=1 Tax=Chlorobaculum sp. 24CR TaxID=2508878 RepID=UPI00100AE36A|nr:hypothetical protein [Chlorobaculum sp. 24CR]RXK88478.1 hypothetical protein EST62_02935 [Chlorobaculum sp. 24CR]